MGIITAGIIALLFRKKISGIFKKPNNIKIKKENIDPRLRTYISSSLAKGFTKEQIKKALLAKGWSQKEIDKVLRAL